MGPLQENVTLPNPIIFLVRVPILLISVIILRKPEDHCSSIAHLSAEDMLKSAVIEEHSCY